MAMRMRPRRFLVPGRRSISIQMAHDSSMSKFAMPETSLLLAILLNLPYSFGYRSKRFVACD